MVQIYIFRPACIEIAINTKYIYYKKLRKLCRKIILAKETTRFYKNLVKLKVEIFHSKN